MWENVKCFFNCLPIFQRGAKLCVFWCAAESLAFHYLAVWSRFFLGKKSSKSKRLFVARGGFGPVSRHHSSHIYYFFHYETRTLRDTDTYIITKNDDDDADDVRDDDAVFVFVFWKKQQKESFYDDYHYG